MSDAAIEVVQGFWAALYERDWVRIRSYFGPDSLYYDVPAGPSTAAKGPDGIEARLRLGLDPLVGYDHDPEVRIASGADGTVMTEHTEIWTWEGGATVALPFVSVQRVADGVITRWRDYWDYRTLMDAAPAAWHERLDTADLSWLYDATTEF
ncbi:MAG: nuclear transport factor 2 family protein [Actinomycetota bacterium]|nr:nuclear transport factor 2 family protein [Acidimicrobiia bacterium]MDQ3294714.1 nuclear transport factor 2 family protein [Actinomycetota bacterium]